MSSWGSLTGDRRDVARTVQVVAYRENMRDVDDGLESTRPMDAGRDCDYRSDHYVSLQRFDTTALADIAPRSIN